MIDTIHKILENRDCGDLRIGYVRVYISDTIGQIALRFGLKNDDSVYSEVDQKVGMAVLNRILSQDMAYSTKFKVDDGLILNLVSGYESDFGILIRHNLNTI